MRHPFGETVGIRTFEPGSEDAHGNPSPSWGSVVDWPGCAIAPSSSAELAGEPRDGTTTTLTVYGPPDMQANPRDIAVYNGLEYAIIGQVERWVNPFNGSAPGCVLTIRRSDG